jgi:hypothetical protein
MKRWILLFLTLVFSAGSARGDGFASLRLGADARTGAMGMTGTAQAGDGTAGYWNPASLAYLQRNDAVLSLHSWIQGVQSEFLGMAAGGERHGFGLYVLYTQVGDIEYRVTPSPEPIATFTAHEAATGLSYGRQFGSRFSVGVTLKALYEKIFIDESVGIALDAGFICRLRSGGPRLAAVIQNMGFTGKLRDQSIRLPFTGRLGLEWPFRFMGGSLILAAEGEKARDLPFHFHSGVEYGWKQRIFLRLGYVTGYDSRDITGGVGFRWGRMRLDYQYMPFRQGLGEAHRVSLGMGW